MRATHTTPPAIYTCIQHSSIAKNHYFCGNDGMCLIKLHLLSWKPSARSYGAGAFYMFAHSGATRNRAWRGNWCRGRRRLPVNRELMNLSHLGLDRTFDKWMMKSMEQPTWPHRWTGGLLLANACFFHHLSLCMNNPMGNVFLCGVVFVQSISFILKPNILWQF